MFLHSSNVINVHSLSYEIALLFCWKKSRVNIFSPFCVFSFTTVDCLLTFWLFALGSPLFSYCWLLSASIFYSFRQQALLLSEQKPDLFFHRLPTGETQPHIFHSRVMHEVVLITMFNLHIWPQVYVNEHTVRITTPHLTAATTQISWSAVCVVSGSRIRVI